MLRDGLAETMRGVAAGYAIPLAWIHAEAGRPVMPSNGSAFLLDAGQGTFLTTARHVYNGFLAAKAEHSDTVCVVGQTRIALQERLRAQDKAHDVATFDVTADEVADLKRYKKMMLRPKFSKYTKLESMAVSSKNSSIAFAISIRL